MMRKMSEDARELTMSREAFESFLENEMVCSLSVAIDAATLHAAAMHFSYSKAPLEFYFSADTSQRKYRPLQKDGEVPAAVVIGLSEEKWVTCQMSGSVWRVPSNDVGRVKAIHYARIPSAQQFEALPTTTFLVFKPSWIRVLDYNTDEPTEVFLYSA